MQSYRALLVVLPLIALISIVPAQAQVRADLSPELIVPTATVPGPQAQARLDNLLYDFAVFDLDSAAIADRVAKTGHLALYFNNQRFDLELELNDLRGPDHREVLMVNGKAVEQPVRPVTTFKGRLSDDPASFVRLSIRPGTFQGYIWTQDEWIFIDPLRNYGPDGSDDVVVYRNADVRPQALGECGAGALAHTAHDLTPDLDLFAVLRLEDGLENSHQRRTLQVAGEGDGQLFQRYGNPGLFNHMDDVFNRVDGIYRNQLNIQLSVVYKQGWSSVSGDPYTSLDAATTLNQFRNWWQSNNGNIARDAAHMFSGKNFNGGTIGIAWVGVICNQPSLSYGVSEDLQNGTLNGRLTAHEIGHNLSSPHDSSGCANCNGSGPIMCSFIQTNGTNTFSSCSRSSISNHVHNNGFCM